MPHAGGRRAHAAGVACARGAPRADPGALGARVSDESLRTPFPQRAHAALEDAHLQEALGIATTRFIGLRKESFAGFPEGEALRDRARAIKEGTLQQLDRHLE